MLYEAVSVTGGNTDTEDAIANLRNAKFNGQQIIQEFVPKRLVSKSVHEYFDSFLKKRHSKVLKVKTGKQISDIRAGKDQCQTVTVCQEAGRDVNTDTDLERNVSCISCLSNKKW